MSNENKSGENQDKNQEPTVEDLQKKLAEKDKQIETLSAQKGHWKKKATDKGGDKGGSDKDKPSKPDKKEVDHAYEVAKQVFLHTGGKKTELHQIKKVMRATNKSFEDARKDTMYTTWKESNDKKLKSKESKLGPSGQGQAHKEKGPQPKTEKEKRFSDSMDKSVENLEKTYKS